MVENRPILLFPTPEFADRTKRSGHGGNPPLPSHDKQMRRLSPKFKELQEQFEARRLDIQQTAAGADPEKVLVIETVGNVNDFIKAVDKIDDLNWMGELADEVTPADKDFYEKGNEEGKKGKKISGSFYLVMTNQKGIEQLVSLWKEYEKNENMAFKRGLTPFRNVFRCLNDIRYWNYKDRIKETNLREVWEEDLKQEGDFVRAEVELWFRKDGSDRQDSQGQVEAFIEQHGGEVVKSCIIPDIDYHAMLVTIPKQIAKQVIANPKVKILECEEVMFFSPAAQSLTDGHVPGKDESPHEPPSAPLPEKGTPAIVGILDGMPIENHEQLAGRLQVDDPDSYDKECPVSQRAHGTSMASLVVQGDLEDKTEIPLSSPVYIRPIMKPRDNEESLPQEEILVDLIHRAVRRMLEGEGQEKAVAPEVKIINLSIGLSYRPFMRSMSPLARLLDWLSYEYNVLFVISAGNQSKIKIEKSWEELQALTEDEREKEIVRFLYKDERNRKIFSPAESINGITVGALHDDATRQQIPFSLLNLFKNRLPSPISTFGGGYRKAIKPDLVFKGGRVYYGVTYRNFLVPNKNVDLPGIKSAMPRHDDISYCAYSRGTSAATALISRAGATCYETLRKVFQESSTGGAEEKNIAPLIKAMILHGCSWEEIGDRLSSILQTDVEKRAMRDRISRWLGYGVPDIERVLQCTDQRATLLGYGDLMTEEAHVFKLPLPESLDGHRVLRRLTITLAWFSPIKSSVQAYRAASLWFDIEKDSQELFKATRQNADWHAVKKGTVQHEVFEGERALNITKGDFLKIKVNCRKDAADISKPVSYGFVVTLGVADGINIPIYDEIKNAVLVAGKV